MKALGRKGRVPMAPLCSLSFPLTPSRCIESLQRTSFQFFSFLVCVAYYSEYEFVLRFKVTEFLESSLRGNTFFLKNATVKLFRLVLFDSIIPLLITVDVVDPENDRSIAPDSGPSHRISEVYKRSKTKNILLFVLAVI